MSHFPHSATGTTTPWVMFLPGNSPFLAKTDQPNGLAQDPSNPHSNRGSSSPDGPTARSRGYNAVAAYASMSLRKTLKGG